jgi:rare lipoprotein A
MRSPRDASWNAKTFQPTIVLDVFAPLISRFANAFVVFFVLLFAACGRRTNSRANFPPPPAPANAIATIGAAETGVASWYGDPYHGRAAANGEIFDMNAFTAAHRTLPFETWVNVQNLSNGKDVNVRITDRGPFVDGRIIDLSRRAAQSIAMIGPGLARVKLTVISPPPDAPLALYSVQLGAFTLREPAEALRSRVPSSFPKAKLSCESKPAPLCRVTVGSLPRQDAAALRQQLKQAGFPGFLLRLELPEHPASGGTTHP